MYSLLKKQFSTLDPFSASLALITSFVHNVWVSILLEEELFSFISSTK